MSEGSTVDAVEATRRPNWRMPLGAAVVAALVGGAALLPTPERAPFEGAGNLIGTAYADGDGAAFVELWEPRFSDQFGDRERLVQDVTGLLSQRARVVGERLAIVRGVPLVVVQTEDNIQWCVRPDGVVLPTCLLGEVSARVDASGMGAVGEFVGGAVNLDRAEVVVELTGTSSEPITVPDAGQLVGETGPWQLVNVQQTAGGQPFPTNEDGTYSVGGPFGITLVFSAELGGGGAWDPIVLTWRAGDAEVDVTIPQPDYWLR